jgi:hypothetical protein
MPQRIVGFTFVFGVIACGIAIASGGSIATAQPVAVAYSDPQNPLNWGVGVIEIPVGGEVIDRRLPPLAIDPVVPASEQAGLIPGQVLFPLTEEIRVAVRPPSEQPIPQPGGGRLLGRLRNLIREVGSPVDEQHQQVIARRLTFLFQPTGKLQLRVSDAVGPIQDFTIAVQPDANVRRELLATWWDGYTRGAADQIQRGDYPTRVESYLVAMLSGRLNLPLPDWFLQQSDIIRSASKTSASNPAASNPAASNPVASNPVAGEDPIWGTLSLIGGANKVASEVFRSVAAGVSIDNGPANVPLPAPPVWAPDPLMPALGEVEIEPMANAVPPECFYLRYGSFENYLWFKNLTEQNGGDIAKMVLIRGLADDAAGRLERQLNLQMTELSKTMGPAVIEDQAIIGTDLYLANGASMGVLLQAKQNFFLRTSLQGDRKRLAANDKSVTLVDDDGFDGAEVSLLSSADGQVRSFMTEAGNIFFVTNSRHLMKRFLEVRRTRQSLAATPAFAAARTSIPVSRNDSLFAYFSPDMIRGLVAPKSLIELRRRMVAQSETSLVLLARLASLQENHAAATDIDSLVAAGYLPRTFGDRPDGSGLIDLGDDEVLDTMRGKLGSYLPIADINIDSVTADEAAWYQSIAAAYSRDFSTIDPLMIGVARSTPAPGIERLTIHGEMSPFRVEKFGKYGQYLGPPTNMAMRFAADDLIAAQAHVASPQLGTPTHLFAAVKDTVPPEIEDFDGFLKTFRTLKTIPGYIGAWPQPGMLDRLPLGLGVGTPVAPGMNRLIGGVYRFTDGSFSLLGFDPAILQNAASSLEAVEVTQPAQVRVAIGDLRGSQFEPWIIRQVYQITAPKSLAGASFLNLVGRQFDISPEETLKKSAEILGGSVQCPLGGEYRYDQTSRLWSSTAWGTSEPPMSPPVGYLPPPLRWFAGGQASLLQEANRLSIDAMIDRRLEPSKQLEP